MSSVYCFYILRSNFSHFHWLVGNLSPTSISFHTMYTFCIPFIRGVFSFSLYRLSAQPVLNCITSPPPLSFLLAATHLRRNNITTSANHNDVIAGSSHICPIPLSPI